MYKKDGSPSAGKLAGIIKRDLTSGQMPKGVGPKAWVRLIDTGLGSNALALVPMGSKVIEPKGTPGVMNPWTRACGPIA